MLIGIVSHVVNRKSDETVMKINRGIIVLMEP